MPALVVFVLVAVPATVSIGAAYLLGKDHLWIPAAACLVLGLALLINDKYGFIRSREMRRAHEYRRQFNAFEAILLIALIIANLLVGVYVYLVP